MPVHRYTVCGCSVAATAERVVVTETAWPGKPRMLTTWPFLPKEFAASCSKPYGSSW